MLRPARQARSRGRASPVGALTVKLAGERLTEMASSPRPAASPSRRQRADHRHAGCCGAPPAPIRGDLSACRSGCARRPVGCRAKAWRTTARWRRASAWPGIPAFTETIALATMLPARALRPARASTLRLSTAAAVEMIRAGEEGKSCRSAATWASHYVHLSELDLGYYDSTAGSTRRCARQRDARGSRGPRRTHHRCAVSDHAHVDEDRKQLPFARPRPARRAWSCLLAARAEWGAEKKSCPPRQDLCARHQRAGAHSRRRIGTLEAGAPADLVLFDPPSTGAWLPGDCASRARTRPPRLRAGGARCARPSSPAAWCTKARSLA